jgi:hypothetical protein
MLTNEWAHYSIPLVSLTSGKELNLGGFAFYSPQGSGISFLLQSVFLSYDPNFETSDPTNTGVFSATNGDDDGGENSSSDGTDTSGKWIPIAAGIGAGIVVLAAVVVSAVVIVRRKRKPAPAKSASLGLAVDHYGNLQPGATDWVLEDEIVFLGKLGEGFFGEVW